MKLAIDRYAYLDSPIHRWQQNCKIVGLLGLIFAFAFIHSLILLPIIIITTGIIFFLSRLPFSYLVSRLRYPGWFILAVVFLLPFMIGETILFQWGELTLKLEGCQIAAVIVVRFFCILTISLVLFGTAPFLSTIKGLRSLGLPQVIVDMTLLAYRYLEEVGEMVNTMERAMKLRGFDKHYFKYRNLQVLARLIGSLLVRSYEKSTRIYQAMILRGYGYQPPSNKSQKKLVLNKNHYQDLAATILTLSIALGLLGLDLFFTIR
ncbi:MAG: cobalt ECF transporter T component CbiQ [Xenococcaceae cyanobacterium MO_234.B1]|nr:cobalt ECF transporter T component CbiQ [Xenococcaceae cyanobacterium MO_234.B1]